VATRGRPRRGRYCLPMAMTADRPKIDDTGSHGTPDRSVSGVPVAADMPDNRVGKLRGAGVQVDSRRLARVGIGIVLVTLAALTVGFTVAGVHKNQQTDELHTQGVPVTVTVTGCLGLLGGSGSNAAGYSCHGTYILHGHHYSEPLPGSAFHRPGSTIASVAVPSDPALVSPVSIADAQHSSPSVFILPAVFGGLLVLSIAILFIRARRQVTRPSTPAAADDRI
jgi:hypothetical protein